MKSIDGGRHDPLNAIALEEGFSSVIDHGVNGDGRENRNESGVGEKIV